MLLDKLEGVFVGKGTNHENETFEGTLTINKKDNLSLYVVEYCARVAGKVIHQELSLLHGESGKPFICTTHFSEFPNPIIHNQVDLSNMQIILRSMPIAEMNNFVSELSIEKQEQQVIFTNSWGFEGDVVPRSTCTLRRTI